MKYEIHITVDLPSKEKLKNLKTNAKSSIVSLW